MTRTLTLATDLDGTFLGGAAADRARLYRWIEENRDRVHLIFVTGRDPDFIRALCDGGVPWPDHVVGDVGTTIAEVTDREIRPIAALERAIADLWGDAGPRVRAALEGAPGLTLQPTAFRYRVSYDLDPAAFDPAALARVTGMGLDALISDNRYFDVLPPGISKGPSLLRLVAHLGLDPARVLCAGDTMNDASLLECGLRAVAVGGSEPALLARVGHLPQVHVAAAPGAAGIWEAIHAHDLHPDTKETADAQ